MRRFLTLLTLVGVAVPILAYAGCKTDCKDDYEMEVQGCFMIFDDPDESDMLGMCIEMAKDEYEDCLEDCDI